MELIPIEKQNYVKSLLTNIDEWKNIIISDELEFQKAIDERNLINSSIKTADNDRKELVKPFKEKSKQIDEWYKLNLDKIKNGLNVINNGISDYKLQEQARIEKKQRELDLKAELERKKIEEQINKENEKIEKYKDKNGAMAQKAELRKGFAIEQMSLVIPNQVQAKKVEGASFREEYELVVFDKKTVITDLVNNGMFDFIDIDTKKLCKKKKLESSFELKGASFRKKIITISRKV